MAWCVAADAEAETLGLLLLDEFSIFRTISATASRRRQHYCHQDRSGFLRHEGIRPRPRKPAGQPAVPVGARRKPALEATAETFNNPPIILRPTPAPSPAHLCTALNRPVGSSARPPLALGCDDLFTAGLDEIRTTARASRPDELPSPCAGAGPAVPRTTIVALLGGRHP